MEFDWTQISADFRQKYEKTFIRVALKEDTPYEVFFVNEVITGQPPQLIIENDAWGELQLNYDTEIDINFDFPEIGYFFYRGTHALIFTKTFLRQWKRGLCSGTGQIQSPYKDFIWDERFNIAEDIIQAAFEPRSLISFEQATLLLGSGNVLSIPLSPSFALGLHTEEKESHLLWFLSIPIGEYSSAKRTITLYAAQMEQEIKDFLNQVGEQCALFC